MQAAAQIVAPDKQVSPGRNARIHGNLPFSGLVQVVCKVITIEVDRSVARIVQLQPIGVFSGGRVSIDHGIRCKNFVNIQLCG